MAIWSVWPKPFFQGVLRKSFARRCERLASMRGVCPRTHSAASSGGGRKLRRADRDGHRLLARSYPALFVTRDDRSSVSHGLSVDSEFLEVALLQLRRPGRPADRMHPEF